MSPCAAPWPAASRRRKRHTRTRSSSPTPQAKEMIATGEGLPAVTKQAQLVEIMGRHLGEVVAGGVTPQEGMDAAAAELLTLL